MTEQTTTEMLDLSIRYRDGSNEDNSLAFDALMSLYSLHDALTSGSPLPAQWPHATEIEELRAKVAKLEKAIDDRRTVEGYCSHPRRELSIDPFDKTVMIDEEFVLTPHLFSGETLDEAFSSAAEWARGQS